MIKLKNILSEQTSSAVGAVSSKSTKSGQDLITVNLYSDPANTKKYDTGVITNWRTLKLLAKSEYLSSHLDLNIKTNQHGNLRLRWFPQSPEVLTGLVKPVAKFYNKNLTNKLREKYIKPIYNPNATFAQTSAPTTDTDIENNFA